MNYRFKLTFTYILIFLVTFTIVRLLLYLTYLDYFSPLSGDLVLKSFIDGLRFDISAIFTFAGFSLFLLSFPINSKIWLKSISIINLFIYLCMILLLIGDLLYFDVVKRHLGDDLWLSMNDAGFVVDFAIKEYWYFLLIIVAIVYLLIRFIFKQINKHYKFQKVIWKKEILLQVIIILVIILGIRGGFIDKPINIINTFGGGSSEYGNLTANAVFCAYHFSRATDNESHNFKDIKKSIEIAQKSIIENDELVEDSNYPLTRKRIDFTVSKNFNKPNIVIFLLESWTPKYIGAYNNKMSYTPVFDNLAKQGYLFKNAFANGDRSIFGITATFLGIPQPIGLHYLATGLEVSNIPRIGNSFNKLGYRTLFLQTSSKSSFRMDAIAKALNFKEYYSMDDFPKAMEYETDETPYFGWDYEALMFLNNKISEQNKPFFAFLFTGTTHEAYVLAAKKFEKAKPHQRNGLNGFLNTLYYSDWAIGEFMKKASKQSWFNNTIFIFTADHVCKFVDNNINERFHIPLLIYSPMFKTHKEYQFYCSQTDILPTIIDLVGIRDRYVSIGKSLLRNYQNRFIIGRAGKEMVYIDRTIEFKHNLKNVTNWRPKNYTDSTDNLSLKVNRFLSIDQTLYYLLKQNKFYY